MSEKPRGGFASDDGMSIVEVVIAAFILFFVLTAVIALVWTTTQMGVSAQERTVITNILSSHMEWVRSLDYDQVGIQGSEPSATIPSQVTRTMQGFTVVITTTVTEGSPGVKEVQVDAVASGPGFPSLTMSQHASIRDYDSALTATTQSAGPRIRFGTSTPTQDTVVYSAYYGNSSLLYIDAKVEVDSENPEAVISELKFTCSGNMLRDGNTIHANVALWQPMTPTVEQRFRWNTEQVDNTGEPDAIADGWRYVRIEATDSDGNPPASVERRFLVDNDAPDVPTSAFSQVMSATEARLGWVSAKDGTDDAWEYGVKIFKINSTGDPVLQNSLDAYGQPIDFKVNPSAFIHSSTNPPAAPATPFSRYTASVRAISPRLLASEYVDIVPTGYVSGGTKAYTTRPLLTGTSSTTYAGKTNKDTYSATTTTNGSVTPPTFGCSSIVYDLYRGTSPTNLTLFRSNTTATFNDPAYKFLGSSPNAPVYYYQYKVTYRALGSTGTTTDQVIYSNVIGPTNLTGTVTPVPQLAW